MLLTGSVSFVNSQNQLMDGLVNNYFFLTDLRDAIQDIALQAGKNVIIADTVTGNVTLTLENETFEAALNSF